MANELENVDWSKYHSGSIDFIFNQGDKLLKDTLTAIRETTNKSYGALAIYTGVLSYCINKLVLGEHPNVYGTMSCALFFCIILLRRNFLPSKITFTGNEPKLLIDKYYEFFTNDAEQLKQYKQIVLKGIQEGVTGNYAELNKRVTAFRNSAMVFLVSSLLCIATLLLQSYLS